MWENLVGRSRPFCAWLLPRLRESLPGAVDGLDAAGLYRAVNTVQPSLIRTEADETTYNLHIVLRFELELALIEGSLSVDDLPAAWDEGMERLLGIQVPSVADGVLQDVHWSAGLFGYFPTYTLGNLIAAQLWERLRDDLPDLDEQLERGEFAPLREWLREHVHRHGRKFPPRELLRRITGEDLRVEPFLRYLREKLADAGVLATAVTRSVAFPALELRTCVRFAPSDHLEWSGLMSRSGSIVVSGAREHNLKDVTVELPRDSLVVITGLSGSGKSSLAFDTIYAEGQRRYVESLSAYARQFLGQMDKPDVDSIEGLSPAISIDQKTTSRNPRSTVGTVTEIYDYLRLLWARIGKPHCFNCGRPIAAQSAEQIIDQIMAHGGRRRGSWCSRRSCAAARASTASSWPSCAARASRA